MTEIKIVDRNEEIEALPNHFPKGRGKWQQIFNSLPSNKAVEMYFSDKKEVERIGRNISSCFSKRKEFRIRYRIVPDGDKFKLYIWKEKR